MTKLEEVLKITPEVVQEVVPTKTAATILNEAAWAAGALVAQRFAHYQFGSGYYVELPGYINYLVARGEITAAAECAARCFEGKGIPSDLWRLMTKIK